MRLCEDNLRVKHDCTKILRNTWHPQNSYPEMVSIQEPANVLILLLPYISISQNFLFLWFLFYHCTLLN